jgi:hypothetical protein
MHIILNSVWEIIIDDNLDVLDVKPAGSHISGH